MLKLVSLLFITLTFQTFSQDWESVSPLPAAGRDDAVAFSLHNHGFVVTGTSDGSDYAESHRLFCYTPETDSWTEKAPFPGVKRQYSSVFTIENTAYLIAGYSESGTALNDVWSYDPGSDQWDQLSDFPGLARWDAASAALNGFGYFGLGTGPDSTFSDLWKYNPKTDEWSKVTRYPAGANRSVVAFPLLDQLIFGQGFDVNPLSYSNAWFSYEPMTNTWKARFSPVGERSYGTAISNGVFAVICGGMEENAVFHNDCFTLDYSGMWKDMTPLGTEGIRGSSGFVITNDFYIGTGLLASGTKTSAFYKRSMDPVPVEQTNVFPNPSSAGFNIISLPGSEVRVYSFDGKLVSETTTDGTGYLRLENMKSGIYLVKVLNGDLTIVTRIEKI